jgi:hypothetical protein
MTRMDSSTSCTLAQDMSATPGEEGRTAAHTVPVQRLLLALRVIGIHSVSRLGHFRLRQYWLSCLIARSSSLLVTVKPDRSTMYA